MHSSQESSPPGSGGGWEGFEGNMAKGIRNSKKNYIFFFDTEIRLAKMSQEEMIPNKETK